MIVPGVDQIREWDAYTIRHEPIHSIDLMERAASMCTGWILEHLSTFHEALIVCGSGNNGGDGLVIARQLALAGWNLTVCYPAFARQSVDFQTNMNRLKELNTITVYALSETDDLPVFSQDALVVDALFGSGLARPVEGSYATWIERLNALPNLTVSVDIPSGVFADKPTEGVAIAADFTLSFEVPKRAFLIPENQQYVGEWIILPIGLSQEYVSKVECTWATVNEQDAAAVLKPRQKFDHKGIYGHALIIAGSYGKAGAAVLASQAALHSGTGLVTAHVPRLIYPVIQTAAPEVMVETDNDQHRLTHCDVSEHYSALGVGCGIGMHADTAGAIKKIIVETNQPMVLDADAINLLAADKEMLQKLPVNTILTPHFKEFARLFGESASHFERMEKLHEAAVRLRVIIVLKGAHTAIATPENRLFFNTTGNPGMATAGSGDVLTGIITGLLAQHYAPAHAAILGVYLHGLAGDLAAEEIGYEALIASDIIKHMGAAYQHLRDSLITSQM